MYGIGGIASHKANALTAAQICDGMLTALKSRGTGTQGTYVSEEVCLLYTGNNSPEDGKQPVRTMLGQKAYVLVYDGELYNKEAIRQELVTLGYQFQDSSDAAVVLYGYMAWGQNCVERFNGVFAFALWDNNQLFMARDRLGLRPLYYSIGAHGLVFASTIKTLLAHPQIRPAISAEGAAEILLLGPGRSPGCGVFNGINELEPASYAIYSGGRIETTTYWKLKARPHREDFGETTEKVKSLLVDSIKLQTSSKMRMATLLSGGLDSSAVAALSRSRESFSVDYFGNDKHFTATAFQPEEDSEYITRMVNFLGLKHRRIVLGSDELADALEDAADARGLPGMADVDASLLLFLREVGKEVQITLSGEGADEIFGGYPWYQDDERLFAKTFPWSQSTEYRAKFIEPSLAQKINTPEAYVNSRFEKTMTTAETLYDDDPREAQIRKMFMLNLHWFLQTLATRNDSMASAAGISVRTPFLDYRLVEYLYNVPWHFKNHNDHAKGLLRESLKGLLPDSVLWRKKSPYPKTHNPAYLKWVTDMLKATDSNAPIFSLVSKTALSNLLKEDSGVNWYGQLMAYPQTIAYFLQINSWMKKYSVIVE